MSRWHDQSERSYLARRDLELYGRLSFVGHIPRTEMEKLGSSLYLYSSRRVGSLPVRKYAGDHLSSWLEEKHSDDALPL